MTLKVLDWKKMYDHLQSMWYDRLWDIEIPLPKTIEDTRNQAMNELARLYEIRATIRGVMVSSGQFH